MCALLETILLAHQVPEGYSNQLHFANQMTIGLVNTHLISLPSKSTKKKKRFFVDQNYGYYYIITYRERKSS